MESFEAVYSDIGLFNQALVGKWVFHGDYMFSQIGTLDGVESNNYEEFYINNWLPEDDPNYDNDTLYFIYDEDEDDADSKESAQNRREAVRAAEKASNYKKAVELLINEGRISISFLQQRLSIGYNNAARICDELQKNNVLGPQPKVGSRPILMSQDELRDLFDSLSDNETESEEKSEEFIEAQSIDYEQNNVQEEELWQALV